MFGERHLCCPVLAPGVRAREVYLPQGGSWRLWGGEKIYSGGKVVEVECPIDTTPVFVRQ
ncbi:unnamed protein product [Diplocarpon coronariae]